MRVTPTFYQGRVHAGAAAAVKLPSLAPTVMSIHRVNRHKFPVLQEEFLVDSNYSFVKELGQGEREFSHQQSTFPCTGLTGTCA